MESTAFCRGGRPPDTPDPPCGPKSCIVRIREWARVVVCVHASPARRGTWARQRLLSLSLSLSLRSGASGPRLRRSIGDRDAPSHHAKASPIRHGAFGHRPPSAGVAAGLHAHLAVTGARKVCGRISGGSNRRRLQRTPLMWPLAANLDAAFVPGIPVVAQQRTSGHLRTGSYGDILEIVAGMLATDPQHRWRAETALSAALRVAHYRHISTRSERSPGGWAPHRPHMQSRLVIGGGRVMQRLQLSEGKSGCCSVVHDVVRVGTDGRKGKSECSGEKRRSRTGLARMPF